MKSLWIKNKPDHIPLENKSKYTVPCPECKEGRHKSQTKSLQVYRDDDGIIRWECYHPGCKYNIRHAAVDGASKDGEEIEVIRMEFALPMTVDPTEEEILQPLIKNSDMVHWYKNLDGQYLFGIRRQVLSDGTKIMTPIAMLSNGDFSVAEYPKVKTLYNAEELGSRPEAPIIVVEGEKAVDLGKAQFPNSVVVTWPGGCNGVDRGDWSLLAGRTVLIWPDNDDAGKKAASLIAQKLQGDVSIAYVNHLAESADIGDGLDPKDVLKALSSRIKQAPSIKISSPITSEIMKQNLLQVNKGIETGWGPVDESIRLRGLTVIEGRSSHGKSTVLFNLANNLLKKDKTVVFYSYEMSSDEVLLRMALLNEKRALDPIPWKGEEKLAKQIVEGTSKGYDKICQHLNKNFFITDENLNIEKLVKELEQPSLRGAVVIIDYIQFIPASPNIGIKARYLQIKDFAEKLKYIAKKQGITVITGAQLTAGDQPAQDVAREGKDIYNAADVVLRVWSREEGKQTETDWSKKDESTADALLLVRKARAGATTRSFDFNFTDTRKMEFNIDMSLRLGE